MVDRIQIREAVTDTARQRRIVVQEIGVAGNGLQRGHGGLPFGFDEREDAFGQRFIVEQIRIALGNRHIGFCQHHIHIAQHRFEKRPLGIHGFQFS